MPTDTYSSLYLNGPMSRDGSWVPGVPGAFVFLHGLRRDGHAPGKLGVRASQPSGNCDWVFHAGYSGTFGSNCQAGQSAESSVPVVHAVPMDAKADFARRLARLLDEDGAPDKHHGRLATLARDWGVTERTAANWLNGDKLPQLERIIEMAVRYRCNAEWLLTGRGEMRPDPSLIHLSESEREHIEAMRALSPEDRAKIFQVTEIFTPRRNPHAA